jgi:Bifunctional DNA primase/polymerase, N-terminal
MAMSGPFASKAQDYAERGFSPLPILRGRKVPGYGGPGHPGIPMQEWSIHCETPLSPAEIERIARMDPNCGIGLACGYRDLVGVDVDDPRAYPITREILGGLQAPVKRGKKGGTAFYRGPGIKNRKFCAKPEKDAASGEVRRPTLVEILARGSQTVIPGSIHPDTGRPYEWIRGSLEDVGSPAELPLITQWHLDQIEEALAPFMAPKREAEPAPGTPVKSITISEIMRRRYQGFADRAFKSEIEDLSRMGVNSGRYLALRRAVCLLGKWVHHGFITENELISALHGACVENRLLSRGEHTWAGLMKPIQYALDISARDPLPELKERPRYL